MDFIVDHAVAIAAIIWGVAILVGIIVAIVAGVRLFRQARASQRRILPPSEALQASAERAQTRVDELGQRSEDLSRATNELSAQVAVLDEVGKMGVDIARAIRSPLKLLGR